MYKKDIPSDFPKSVKAYHFSSSHPKFEVEIPTHGTKCHEGGPCSREGEAVFIALDHYSLH